MDSTNSPTESRRKFQESFDFKARRDSRFSSRLQNRKEHREAIYNEMHKQHLGTSTATTSATCEATQNWFILLTNADKNDDVSKDSEYIRKQLIDAADDLTVKAQLAQALEISHPCKNGDDEETDIAEYLDTHETFTWFMKVRFPESMRRHMLYCMAKLGTQNHWGAASKDVNEYFDQVRQDCKQLVEYIDNAIELMDEMNGHDLLAITQVVLLLMDRSLHTYSSIKLEHEVKLAEFASKLTGSRLAWMIDHLPTNERPSFARRARSIFAAFAEKMMGEEQSKSPFLELQFTVVSDSDSEENYEMGFDLSDAPVSDFMSNNGRRGVGRAQSRQKIRAVPPEFRKLRARTRGESIRDTIQNLKNAASSTRVHEVTLLMGSLVIKDKVNVGANIDEDGKEMDVDEEEIKDDGISFAEVEVMTLNDMPTFDDNQDFLPRVFPEPRLHFGDEDNDYEEMNEIRAMEHREAFQEAIERMKRRSLKFRSLSYNSNKNIEMSLETWHKNAQAVILDDSAILSSVFRSDRNGHILFDEYMANKRNNFVKVLVSFVVKRGVFEWTRGYPLFVKPYLDDRRFIEKYLNVFIREFISTKSSGALYFRGPHGVEMYKNMLSACRREYNGMFTKLFHFVSGQILSWENEELIGLQVLPVLKEMHPECDQVEQFFRKRLIKRDIFTRIRGDIMEQILPQLETSERSELILDVLSSFVRYSCEGGIELMRYMIHKNIPMSPSLFFMDSTRWVRRIFDPRAFKFLSFIFAQNWNDVAKKIQVFHWILKTYQNRGKEYYSNLGDKRFGVLCSWNDVLDAFWAQKVRLFREFEQKQAEYAKEARFGVKGIQDGLDSRLKIMRCRVNKMIEGKFDQCGNW